MGSGHFINMRTRWERERERVILFIGNWQKCGKNKQTYESVQKCLQVAESAPTL